MTNLIRGEAIKMRSTRTALASLTAGVVLTVLFTLALDAGRRPFDAGREARCGQRGPPAYVLFVVFGVVGATGEYRHRTRAPAG